MGCVITESGLTDPKVALAAVERSTVDRGGLCGCLNLCMVVHVDSVKVPVKRHFGIYCQTHTQICNISGPSCSLKP